MKKKTFMLAIALVLLVAIAVGSTVAWLHAKSDVVTNTFTASNIKVTLTETTGTEYKMVPGYELKKDPTAKVLAGSEDCYLFVKLTKSANFDTYLSATVADGWTKLDGVTDTVYYRIVTKDGANGTGKVGESYSVLAGDKVTVLGSVTEAMMEAAENNKPTLTITAYASQYYKNNNATDNTFTALQAWNNITSK